MILVYHIFLPTNEIFVARMKDLLDRSMYHHDLKTIVYRAIMQSGENEDDESDSDSDDDSSDDDSSDEE